MIYSGFYDFFRAIRIVRSPNLLRAILQDLLYFFFISLLTFIFFLSISNGEIRAYILFGIAIGFSIFYKIVSPYFLKALTFVIKIAYKLF